LTVEVSKAEALHSRCSFGRPLWLSDNQTFHGATEVVTPEITFTVSPYRETLGDEPFLEKPKRVFCDQGSSLKTAISQRLLVFLPHHSHLPHPPSF
jgi:hypothetical protein